MKDRSRRAAAPIAIQPLGEVPADQVAVLETILSRSFSASTVVLRPVVLPTGAWDPLRRQFDADVLLDVLFQRLPERCLRVVGVTEGDLFIQGRTFVFGYAHLADGMALYSTHRLRETFYARRERPPLLAQRVLRAVVHELGHTFGVPHCDDESCVMHAVSHVETLDALPARYCSDCRPRVREGLVVEPWSARGRWERGLAFARRRLWGHAIAQLEHAARSAPLEPRFHHDLGIARLGAGDPDGARQALRRAAELRGELVAETPVEPSPPREAPPQLASQL